MTAEVKRPEITMGVERLVERLNEVQNVSCPLTCTCCQERLSGKLMKNAVLQVECESSKTFYPCYRYHANKLNQSA